MNPQTNVCNNCRRWIWVRKTMGRQTYVDWIKRATRISKMHMEMAGIEDWADGQKRLEFILAGHLAWRNDGLWSSKMLTWEPIGQRRVGRQRRDGRTVFGISSRSILVRKLAAAGMWLLNAERRGGPWKMGSWRNREVVGLRVQVALATSALIWIYCLTNPNII